MKIFNKDKTLGEITTTGKRNRDSQYPYLIRNTFGWIKKSFSGHRKFFTQQRNSDSNNLPVDWINFSQIHQKETRQFFQSAKTFVRSCPNKDIWLLSVEWLIDTFAMNLLRITCLASSFSLFTRENSAPRVALWEGSLVADDRSRPLRRRGSRISRPGADAGISRVASSVALGLRPYMKRWRSNAGVGGYRIPLRVTPTFIL